MKHVIPLLHLKIGVLLFVFISFCEQGYSQKNITGIVLDKNNETIIGANVIVKGSKVGTTTDFEGKFQIEVSDPQTAILRVSYVGYVTQNIPVKSQKFIRVILLENSKALEEVVVVAYGTQKKETLTGSISSVGTDELLVSPNASITNSLSGKMTGVSTVQSSGQPGREEADIYIRGVGSLTTGNSKPLILVDGVENTFSQMDPNEIESITVLKDASATAVFGVRGANGVIIVTTKRGKEGKASIQVNSSVGVEMPTRLVKMADSYTFAINRNRMAVNDGYSKEDLPFNDYSLERFRLMDDPIMFPNINWRDELMKKANIKTQHNLNISGGTKKAKYFVSLGYLYQDGLFKQLEGLSYDNGYDYNRFNYRSNLDLNVSPTTTIKVNIGGIISNTHEPVGDVWGTLNWTAPMSCSGIENGKVITPDPERFNLLKLYNNIMSNYYGTGFQNQMNNKMSLDLLLNQKLDFVTKGLSVEIKGSYNTNYSLTKSRSGGSAYNLIPYYTSELDGQLDGIVNSRDPNFNPDNIEGYNKDIIYKILSVYKPLGYSESYGRGRNWYMEGSLRYNRKFNSHNVGALLLYNQSKRYYMGGDFNAVPRAYVGLVGRATYDYRSKYLAEINIGYNGSENFAKDNRYGFFPAGSLGYVISEEGFFKNQKLITYLKLRASVGLVGNDNIGSDRFLYLPGGYDKDLSGTQKTNNASYNMYGYNFGYNTTTMINGSREIKLGNPLVTWEKALKQNYGFDLYMLQNKLKISADLFYENRKDILITRGTVPLFTGLSKDILPAVNMGKVNNHGYEIEVKWRDKANKLIYWVDANMSFVRNKIIEQDEIPHQEAYMYRTGHPVGTIFGYKSNGMYQKEDFKLDEDGNLLLVNNAPVLKEGIPIPIVTVYPGDAKYLDLNNDKVVDENDVTNIGKPKRPEYTIGLNLGIEYKGFFASMNWTGVTGCNTMLSSYYRNPYSGGNRTLFQVHADECWTEETAYTATMPRMSLNAGRYNQENSQIWIKDASYIKLKNVSVGYNIRKNKRLKKVGIQSLGIQLTGYNLLTFDHLKIMDPEGNPNDYDTYPIMKIYNLGVNINF